MKTLGVWFGILVFAGFGMFPLPAQSTRPLTLEECIRIALKENAQIKIASQQLSLARYNYKGSFQNILPTLRVSYGMFRFERGPTSYLGGEYVGEGIPALNRITRQTDYSFSLNLNQNIYDGGFWWNNIRKTRVEREAEAYNFESEKQKTVMTVMERYFTLLKEQKLLEVYQEAVRRSEEQLNRAQSMYELGSVAQVDVYRAKVNLGNDRIQYLNQKNVVERARQDLNIAMGRDPREPLEIVTELEFHKYLENIDNLFQEALEKNPQLKKLKMDLQSMQLQAKLAFSNFLPQVSSFFSYSRRVPEFEGLYRELDREYTWTVGLQLSWNLFNGFADYINVQKAKVNQKLLREQLLDFQRNLLSNIKSLYDNLKAYDEIIAINQDNLEAAREEYRLAQERYRIGSGTALELREAQLNLTRAEQILISAEYDAIINYARLLEAIGRLAEMY
ncbi:MAG: TolC family protein [Calditrichaeota bacterium]|nr:TolC family protein [Calditrichota bacterium]